MTLSAPTRAQLDAGTGWLLKACAAPTAARALWAADKLAPIRTGRGWLAVEAPIPVTVNALARIPLAQRGPVLAEGIPGRAWWLIAEAAASDLDDIGLLTIRPPGWTLYCPPAHHPAGGRLWFEAPDGTGHLTDPALLGAALGPGGPLPALTRTGEPA